MKKSKKITKINNVNIKKLLFIGLFFFLLLLFLIARLIYLQFVQGDWLSKQASSQQIQTKTITPNRGIIYDSTGKILAISADVDTISVNPTILKYSNGDSVSLEFVAQSFSDIFDLDYNEILDKLNSSSSYITIASKIETDKVDLLKDWMNSNNIYSGINIDSSIKRYYPNNNLASHLIGFTGTDGNGLFGLENSLDSILAGTVGKVVSVTDSVNGEIPNQQQSYVEEKDGSNVYLTIDYYVQSIVEKYLSQAVIDNSADYGTAIIMEPSTGNILAMANYPDYNLNSPFTPTDSTILETWNELSSAEQTDYLYDMWRNKAVQNTYEPGSTFKIITSAVALEENIVNSTDEIFFCSGTEVVENTPINCWRSYNPHGTQNLKEALANSCNPAFIQLGLRIGAPTLYKYYQAFGLFSTTGSSLYGESSSVFHNINSVGQIELATMAFGQGITITPLQLITAVSAIANEGVLMQPQIISKIEDTNTGSITYTEPVEIRHVISKETATEMMNMLDYVVSDGTGGYADVKGYSIGGKSGTSEDLTLNNGTYVASFIGVSPTINTQAVVLVALYNPKGDSFQGGQVAGPVVGQIFSEILPYLNVASSSSSASSYNTTAMPNVKNKTVAEAKELLEASGFVVHTYSDANASDIIVNQMPKAGSSLLDNADVFIYTDETDITTSVSVPNFKGKTISEAIDLASDYNLNISLEGSGIVISQDVPAETSVEPGSIINLTLKSELDGGW